MEISPNCDVGHLIAAQRLLIGARKLILAVDQDTKQNGVMIAFAVPPEIGQQIAVPSGEPVEDMHITLVYFGSIDRDIDQAGVEKLKSIMKSVSDQQVSLSGILGGYGRFSGQDADVFYASVDVPGLGEYRARLVEAISASGGLHYRNNHGFSPHVTLKYLEPVDAPSPALRLEPIDITFTEAILKVGQEITTFGFGKTQK